MTQTAPLGVHSNALVNFLRVHSAYSAWAPETHVRLAEVATRVQRPEGVTLLHAGTAAEHVYLLSYGVVEAVTVISSGEQHVSTFMHAGACMGLAALFLKPPVVRQQIWIAHTDVIYWRIPVSDFRECFWSDRVMAESLLHTLAARVVWLTQAVGKATLLPAQCKVLACLLDLAEPTSFGGDGRSQPLKLTQAKLAQMLGLTRQSVSNVLRDLEARGMITVARQKIEVVSSAQLRKYAIECGAARMGVDLACEVQ